MGREIYSSTGALGPSRRPFDRLYVNGATYSADVPEVLNNWRRAVEIGTKHERIGRTMYRGLVSDELAQRVLRTNELHQQLEVALDVSEFTDDPTWLIYMAENKAQRQSIHPVDQMIAETSGYRRAMHPESRALSVLEAGSVFVDRLSEDQIDQVDALWEGTFGWNRQEVDNLRKRIEEGAGKEPSERDVWFSGIVLDGQLVTAAMAERLTIPAPNGKTLDLVESTEWRTKDGYAGRHLMTATLDMLNAQILADLRDDGNSRIPLIYAECNFQSRSDRAGHGAGFRIPDRDIDGNRVPQILAQNVGVNDGNQNYGPFRDFTFLYLPKDVITRYYNPEQVARMLNEISTR
jgi:hypothetical protein